jgi:DUF971 family protein
VTRPWPTELRVADGGARLIVRFDDGASFNLPAPYLRSHTPSAADRGHGPITPLPEKPEVRLTDVRPVGRYAVKLVFDDGHDTGLYTFDQLYDLGTAL